MILAELRNLIRHYKALNMLELQVKLNADPDVIRTMLTHWLRKGCIRRQATRTGCGTKCGKCNPLLTEVYEWVA